MLAANSFRPVNQIEFTLYLLAPQYEHMLFRVTDRNEIVNRSEVQRRGLRADQVEVCPERVIEQEAVPVAAAATPAPATPASAAVEVPAVGGPIIEYGLQMAKRGIRIHPLWPKTKLPILKEWETKATTDEATIRHWAAQYPSCNYGPVAYPDGIWLFESDDPSVLTRIEMETGNELPDTFTVESRPGRQHFYFKQNESSRRMGNLAQGFVYHGDFSVRQNKQFCVGPGSLHPVTGEPYKIVSASEIVEAPEWFIKWLLDQKIQPKKTVAASPDTSEIPSGQRNATLASIAGKFRANGASYEVILAHITEINSTRCNPPLPQKDLETIAGSISKYKAGSADPIFLGGVPLDGSTTPAQTMATAVVSPAENEVNEALKAVVIPYPEFPRWVMEGTCLYEDFAKPICDANPSRCPEFMWIPAMTLLLNFISDAVHIHFKGDPFSFFSLLIAPPQTIYKSSCVNDAVNFFKAMEFVEPGARSTAGTGKTLIYSPGSTEGLGLSMAESKCVKPKAVMYYDEFTKLVKKAGYESSSLATDLCTLYESGYFSNGIKAKKQSYGFDAGTYCASFIACTTDRGFSEGWPKLGETKASGLWSRFFFLLPPREIATSKPRRIVPTSFERTRQLILRAITEKREFNMPESRLLDDLVQRDGRAEIRAEKLALGFAITLGREDIDEDCIRRAVAVAEYDLATKKYLDIQDAETREARIQMTFLRCLRKHDGQMTKQEVHDEMRPERLGTTLWSNVYNGLLRNGWIVERGSGAKGDPIRVALLRLPTEDRND